MKAKVMCCAEDFQAEVEQFLDDAMSGVESDKCDDIEVRFIIPGRKFRHGGVGNMFVYRGQWYYWTQNKRAKGYMTLADFELTGRMQSIDQFANIKIYPVIFAGFYTGYIDDRGRKIYTGDVVKATMSTNIEQPSLGGRSRAKTFGNNKSGGYTAIVGVDSFADRSDDYYYILDNCPMAMKHTTAVRVIGNVFYDLEYDHLNVNIADRCAMLAYPHGINLRNLHNKMTHAPYFISKT